MNWGQTCQRIDDKDRKATDVGNNSVDSRPSIAKPVLTSCKFTKVTRRQRCSVVIQPEDDAANTFAVDRNVKLCER
jgi:hypothetical protein